MEEIVNKCPQCGSDSWDQCRKGSEDPPSWGQDENGKIYSGPAYENIIRSCAHCKWKQIIIKEHGKIMAVQSDPLKGRRA